MLYQSNKLMYDRTTNSVWNQFTGEPVVGPLASSGIRLDFFPSVLTTWEEWLAEHPDTTVLNIDTGVYSPARYANEWEPHAIYYDYFASPLTMFPVFNRDETLLHAKETVIGRGHRRGLQGVPCLRIRRRACHQRRGGRAGSSSSSGRVSGARAGSTSATDERSLRTATVCGMRMGSCGASARLR